MVIHGVCMIIVPIKFDTTIFKRTHVSSNWLQGKFEEQNQWFVAKHQSFLSNAPSLKRIECFFHGEW